MEKRKNLTEYVSHIKTLSEHLKAIEDRIPEKDLVILLISSLPEEYNYLITTLESMVENHLIWDYVRDRLIHESEKQKPWEAEKTNDSLFVLTPDKKSIKCHYSK